MTHEKQTHIVLGPAVKADMERQSMRLWREWRLTVSHSRRVELARQMMAIALLLGDDVKPSIGKLLDGK